MEIKELDKNLLESSFTDDFSFGKLNQTDIMALTKANILFLSNLKSQGMLVQSESGFEFLPNIKNQQYRDILDDSIIELTSSLMSMNRHIIKKFSSKIKDFK